MDAIRKVLVVDDDPVVGKSFARVLSGKGYAVITARNGEEALTKLHNETYDLVFTDIKMPGMNGLEVAERLRETQPWLPVVIVTGYGTDAHQARAKAAGVSGFLHKPLSPEMIEGSTQQALREKVPAAAPQTAAKATVTAAPAVAEKESVVKNIALFFAAPFIGLAYIVALPFIGLGVLAWRMGGRELMKYRAVKNIAVFMNHFSPLSPEMIEGGTQHALREKVPAAAPQTAAEATVTAAPAVAEKESVVKNIALFFAAPFIGLAYLLAFPFIGLGILAWRGGRELMKYRAVNRIAVFMKHFSLLVAAPLLGLAYIVALPFIGLAMLAWAGVRAIRK